MSKWESDKEIVRLRVTKDESIPNGIDPVVPFIPREPDAPVNCHCCMEVE